MERRAPLLGSGSSGSPLLTRRTPDPQFGYATLLPTCWKWSGGLPSLGAGALAPPSWPAGPRPGSSLAPPPTRSQRSGCRTHCYPPVRIGAEGSPHRERVPWLPPPDLQDPVPAHRHQHHLQPIVRDQAAGHTATHLLEVERSAPLLGSGSPGSPLPTSRTPSWLIITSTTSNP